MYNGIFAKLLFFIRIFEFSIFYYNPKITSIHCMVHRLALAVGQASKQIMAVNKVLTDLDALHRYFSKSFVRAEGFKSVQVGN